MSAEISDAMDAAVLIWEYLLPSYASTPIDTSTRINPATGNFINGSLEITVNL